jgi:uncharacterized protein (DUF1330 family)
MSCYFIATIDVTDKSWVRAYLKEVTPLVERHGGRYLARTPKVEILEGGRKPPGVCVILEFPSREAALAFYESPEYAPHRRARQAGAVNEGMLVAGEDFAGGSSK